MPNQVGPKNVPQLKRNSLTDCGHVLDIPNLCFSLFFFWTRAPRFAARGVGPLGFVNAGIVRLDTVFLTKCTYAGG